MKQFSIILNIVLLFAVGFLYYLHFSGNKRNKMNPANVNSSANTNNCATTPIPVIAYVDLDSLNNNVTFIKEKRGELEAEQNQIQAEYQNRRDALEAKKDEFMKKGRAITQQEAEAFQAQLMQSAQQIEDDKQNKAQVLGQKSADMMQQMQTRLKTFLDDYNKQKKYTYILATGTGLDYMFYKDSTLNITQDVVKGLNEQAKTDNH
jgi:outer membrane protein